MLPKPSKPAPAPPPSDIQIVNELLSKWCLSRFAYTSTQSGPKHQPSWSMSFQGHPTIILDPAVDTVTGPTKQLLKAQLAGMLMPRLVKGTPLLGVRPQDKLVFPLPWPLNHPGLTTLQFDVESEFPGKGLKFKRPGDVEEQKDVSFETELLLFSTRNAGSSVGMDFERDTGTGRTTLCQLSDGEVVLLFRPHPRSTSLPTCLAKFLEDTTITKMVVDDTEDSKGLKADFGITCGAAQDLQGVASSSFGFAVIHPNTKKIIETKPSMDLLASYFLSYDMEKKKEISKSFTEASFVHPLTAQQGQYGTIDAILAYEIGQKMASIRALSLEQQRMWMREIKI